MTEDLITRLRTLMAEIEARLQSSPAAYPELTQPTPSKPKPLIKLDDPSPTTAGPMHRSSEYTRDTSHLKDYVPSDVSHGEGFDEAVFLGTGDTYDPLHHQRYRQG